MVQPPTELDTHHIYALVSCNDLPLVLILLAVDHKIDHKYPKSLSIPIFNTAYNGVYIPRATVICALNPAEVESTEIINISCMKTERSQDDMRNSSTELPTIPPESSFQPEYNELKKQSLILQDTHVLQCQRSSRKYPYL